jgi:hypothetical protein
VAAKAGMARAKTVAQASHLAGMNDVFMFLQDQFRLAQG